MGLISRSVGFQALSMEDPAQPLLPASAMFESLGLGRSDAGILVNEKQAMRLTTAFICIKVISEDLSRLSLEILQSMPDGSVRQAKEHRCWALFANSMVLRGAIVASVNGWGNAYVLIKRDRANRVISLSILDSGKTSPVMVEGKFMYGTTQTANGQVAYIDPEDMLHIPGLSFDGLMGMSPIQTCKNAFGLGLAAEKFGAQFFGNGARATGVLSHPGVLDTEAYENLKKSVREMATGDNALRPMIFEEGMKWQQITIAPNDAQMLETRKFQREEIAGLYRVPLHLIGSLERSTNNNIEHQGLDYVRFCLQPWAVRIEQEINKKLLSGPYFAEHNFNDMQRGDFASQTAGFQILRNIGVYSTNDILRDMRKNPIPTDEGGDVRTVQGAMIPLDSMLLLEGKPAVPETAGTDSGEGDPESGGIGARGQGIRAAYRRLFRDAVGRVASREKRDEELIQNVFQPIVASMCEAILASRFGNGALTDKDNALIRGQIKAISSQCHEWNKKNASEVATQITESVYSALAGEILE